MHIFHCCCIACIRKKISKSDIPPLCELFSVSRFQRNHHICVTTWWALNLYMEIKTWILTFLIFQHNLFSCFRPLTQSSLFISCFHILYNHKFRLKFWSDYGVIDVSPTYLSVRICSSYPYYILQNTLISISLLITISLLAVPRDLISQSEQLLSIQHSMFDTYLFYQIYLRSYMPVSMTTELKVVCKHVLFLSILRAHIKAKQADGNK